MRLAVTFAALGLVACAPKPKESKVARDIKIVRDENQPDKLFEKGKQFHAVGDLTRAEQYYAAALEQGYPAEAVLVPLLKVCNEAKRFQVGIDYAEPVLNKNPRNYRLRLIVASFYRAIGHLARARGHYEVALTDQPEDPTAHYLLAVLLRDEFRDLVNADKHFREYLRLAPEGPHAEEARGSLLKEVPEPPKSAEKSAEKSVENPAEKSTPKPVPLTSPNTKPTKIP